MVRFYKAQKQNNYWQTTRYHICETILNVDKPRDIVISEMRIALINYEILLNMR